MKHFFQNPEIGGQDGRARFQHCFIRPLKVRANQPCRDETMLQMPIQQGCNFPKGGTCFVALPTSAHPFCYSFIWLLPIRGNFTSKALENYFMIRIVITTCCGLQLHSQDVLSIATLLQGLLNSSATFKCDVRQFASELAVEKQLYISNLPYQVCSRHENPGDVSVEKDTALAWFMPTKTATQRITLDHSLLNLCGSPRCLSMQGYNNPMAAAKAKQNAKGTAKDLHNLSFVMAFPYLQ